MLLFQGLTEEEIVAQSFILMIAGFETTSTTISFFLYNMATNIDCQEKLQKEIEEVVGDSVSTVSYRGLIEYKNSSYVLNWITPPSSLSMVY